MIHIHEVPLFVAYIDPGSGALALQILVVSALAFVARISGLFHWRKKDKNSTNPPSDGSEQ